MNFWKRLFGITKSQKTNVAGENQGVREVTARAEIEFIRPDNPRIQSLGRKERDYARQILDIATQSLCQICGKHPTGPNAVAAIKRLTSASGTGDTARIRVCGICSSCASGKSDDELSELMRKD